MKLPVSNSNAPIWRDLTVKSELPAELKPLDELARNLWWVWNSEGKSLFRALDPDLWRSTGENPVMVKNLIYRQLVEILRFVICNLLPIDTTRLRKIAITIKKTDGCHINAAVRGFFYIISRKDTQTTGIYFQSIA